MPTDMAEFVKKLSPERQQRIKELAAKYIAEEMTLRQLRKARKLTQARVAKALGVAQSSVARIEQNTDLLLSTLQKTVRAMGGNLSLVAEFPDGVAVALSCLADAPVEKKVRKAKPAEHQPAAGRRPVSRISRRRNRRSRGRARTSA
jgi:transcriptional regulator with XRE-family HTH domain